MSLFSFTYKQGDRVFFIVTNYVVTPNQKLGFCPEVRQVVVLYYCLLLVANYATNDMWHLLQRVILSLS